MLLALLARRYIREGTLQIVFANGRRATVGSGAPRFTVRLHDRWLDWSLLINPQLRVREAFMDGRLTLEQGDLRSFLACLARNIRSIELERRPGPLARWWNRWMREYNPVSRARVNVAHHYDLSSELYDLFLDADRQYSCAYFAEPSLGLDQAQQAKKVHLAAKLRLDRPGLRVLDIGSGWGGLGLYLARETGADVTGVTLSVEQHRLSSERAVAEGLADRCRFVLQDYREERGRYDRIVSVGMFEHVGRHNYHEFFERINQLLAEDGVCVIHSIGRSDAPSPTDPFVRKYIFPGGDLPSLSEVVGAVARVNLLVTDIEILRLHYAETLKAWYERVRAQKKEIVSLYDERFFRMWSLYLVGAEMGFRHQGLMVFQLQLVRRIDGVPITRDYMVDWERSHWRGTVSSA